MGFIVKKPKMPTAQAPEPAVTTSVATETVQEDVTRDYEQKRSNKRGILSTILNNHNKNSSLAPQGGGNTTLG